jgi:hypothetical protein
VLEKISMGVENMQSTAVLKEPESRQDVSSVEDAIASCNNEIERRGRMLIGNGEGLSEREFWAYARLASDIGYKRMTHIGNEILQSGGTFPRLRIESVVSYRGRFVLQVSEDGTDKRMTIPCAARLRQYEGEPVKSLDDFNRYAKEPVTVDVRRIGGDYRAIMIGRAHQVLGDGPQSTRLDLIR